MTPHYYACLLYTSHSLFLYFTPIYTIMPVSYTHLDVYKRQILESTMQLADNIIDTNTRIDALESKVKNAHCEQSVRLVNKHKELRVEWKKDLEDIHKQINDGVNEQMNVIKHEQDSKIQDVHDLLQVTTSKTNEIESRTIVIENKIEETS